MDLGSFLQAFVTVFLAELPDKTMVASVVLVARYRRPTAVWAGATLAFAVHVAVAVLAGRLVSELPETPVQLVVAVLFAAGSVLLFRSARSGGAHQPDRAAPEPAGTGSAVAGSFTLVVAAEWGDLTQLTTASLTARGSSPLGVALGALLALSSVSGLAVIAGRQLVARVPLRVVNLVAAAVFATLALMTVVRLLA